jgi:hypothetical protein
LILSDDRFTASSVTPPDWPGIFRHAWLATTIERFEAEREPFRRVLSGVKTLY